MTPIEFEAMMMDAVELAAKEHSGSSKPSAGPFELQSRTHALPNATTDATLVG